MGFFDVIKDIGKDILDSAKERQERILHYKEMFADYNDERLFRKYKSSTGEAKIACGLLLKERGYGNQSDE